MSDRGRVRLLTLDRPEKLNAFDAALYALGADALEAAAADPGVHAVVLTGRGRAFSAGVDLRALEAMAGGQRDPAFLEAARRFEEGLEGFPKPLLAAVNGLAVGIGATLLTYADLVFAARSARFRLPFASLGVAPELGSSWRLPQLVGWQNAAWLLFSSEWVDAARAVEMGLAFRCVPDAALLDEALAAAAAIAAFSRESLSAIKHTLNAWRRAPGAAARALEGEEFARLLSAGFRSPL